VITEEALISETQRLENREMKACKCGIFHTGYYGDICAVCMVCKRVGMGRHEVIGDEQTNELKIHN